MKVAATASSQSSSVPKKVTGLNQFYFIIASYFGIFSMRIMRQL